MKNVSPPPTGSEALSPPLAALLPHEEELRRKRELLSRVKTTRDATLLNRRAVKGDPTKQYFWVNVREERQAFFLELGFDICRDPSITINQRWKQPDGTYKSGDLVLYEIDKEWYDAYNDINVLAGIEAISGNTEEFMGSASRTGVPAFVPKR
jgi:hypothetical protein